MFTIIGFEFFSAAACCQRPNALGKAAQAYQSDGRETDARLVAWLHVERSMLLDGRLGQADPAREAYTVGFARVLAAEHPELSTVRLDLDPARPPGELAAIAREVTSPDAEDQIAFRAGERLALLLDGQRVQVLDAHRGTALLTFDAPAPPIPAGLPDHYTKGHRPDFGFPGDLLWLHGQRLVRIAPHFVSIWSIDGTKVAEFVVPG